MDHLISRARQELLEIRLPYLSIREVFVADRPGLLGSEPHIGVRVNVTDETGRQTVFQRALYHTLDEVRLRIAGIADPADFAREVAAMVDRTARDVALSPHMNDARWFRIGYEHLLRVGGLGGAASTRQWKRLLSRLRSDDCTIRVYSNLIVIADPDRDQFLHFGELLWCSYLAYHGVLSAGDPTWAYDDVDEMVEGGPTHVGIDEGGLENLWM